MNSQDPFTDPEIVSRYTLDTPRKVPGLTDLHRMAMLLLAERAPGAADILVLGAGGGLELKAFAEARPRWRLVGVDPSTEMLDLARRVLGPLQERVVLQQGYIDAAPQGPFDGGVCLLTLHFLQREERLATLRKIHQRLKPGARFVAAHHSAPQASVLLQCLTWSAAFASGPDLDFARALASAETMAARLPVLSAEEDAALMKQAGFAEVTQFYAAFSLRGWVAAA